MLLSNELVIENKCLISKRRVGAYSANLVLKTSEQSLREIGKHCNPVPSREYKLVLSGSQT